MSQGEIIMPDYYNKDDHDKILLERINKTLLRSMKLKKMY
jgi:hypothetical protein